MNINRLFFPSLHSTNDFAMVYMAKNTPIEGTVISTHNQTKGKGQSGRNWMSGSKKNITLSLILYPTFLLPKDHFFLNMVFSISLVEFLSQKTSYEVLTKWPNDIIINDSKIAGILLQSTMKSNSISTLIGGVGINIHSSPEILETQTIHLQKLTNQSYDLDELEMELCTVIMHNYLLLKSNEHKDWKRRYLNNLYKRGEVCEFVNVKNSSNFLGEIIGVNEIGQLIIQVNNQLETFNQKEVKMIIST